MPEVDLPFPRDGRMPELETALQPRVVSALLAPHASSPSGAVFEVLDCRLSRIRYRKHERCFLQYALTLRDTTTGVRHEQWLTGALFGRPGRAERRWRRAGKTAGVAYAPELSMLLNVFPHDRKLTHAVELASGTDPAIRDAVLAAFGPGHWDVVSVAAVPVRYREHLSLVVRYEVTAQEAGTGTLRSKVFYAKGFPTGADARRVHGLLSQLARDTSGRHVRVRVDAPLACLPHLDALLFEATPGTPLDTALDDTNEVQAWASLREAARAVARFNGSDIAVPRAYVKADYAAWLDRPCALLAWACPELAVELREAPSVLAETPRNDDLRPSHRDMKPEHVLLSPNGAAFIDLDSCARAEPVSDTALMLARLAARATAGGQTERMTRYAECFADEYFSQVPSTWKARLPVFFACSLLEVASGIFHRQESGWERRIRALIRLSAESATHSPNDVMRLRGLDPA